VDGPLGGVISHSLVGPRPIMWSVSSACCPGTSTRSATIPKSGPRSPN
jgi:hypothetical protein